MATISMDSLDMVQSLKTAGFPQEQAEAIVQVVLKAQADLVTKRDLKDAVRELKTEMSIRFERIEGELKLNRWMMGLLLAGVLTLVLKTFF